MFRGWTILALLRTAAVGVGRHDDAVPVEAGAKR